MLTILITNLTNVEDFVKALWAIKMGTYLRWLWVGLELVWIFIQKSTKNRIAGIPIEFSWILQLLSFSIANSLNNAENFAYGCPLLSSPMTEILWGQI